jgi:DNA-binding response OmpR family regulator
MPARSTGRQPTHLILGLEPSLDRLISEILGLEGYLTRTTRSSAEALRLLGRMRGRCIVLMDNIHVSEEAHHFLAALRARPRLRRRVQTIGVAAMDYDWVRSHTGVDHLDGFIQMPFGVEQLLAPVEALSRTVRSRRRRVVRGGGASPDPAPPGPARPTAGASGAAAPPPPRPARRPAR